MEQGGTPAVRADQQQLAGQAPDQPERGGLLDRGDHHAQRVSVTCVLDEDDYPTGITGSWDELERLPVTFAAFRGEWNYTMCATRRDEIERG